MKKIIILNNNRFKNLISLLKNMSKTQNIKLNFIEDGLLFKYVNNDFTTSSNILINTEIIKYIQDEEKEFIEEEIMIETQKMLKFFVKIKNNKNKLYLILKNNKLRFYTIIENNKEKLDLDNQDTISEIGSFDITQKKILLENKCVMIDLNYNYLMNSLNMIPLKDDIYWIGIKSNENEFKLSSLTKTLENKRDINLDYKCPLINDYKIDKSITKYITLHFYNEYLNKIKMLKPDNIKICIYENITTFKINTEFGIIDIFTVNRKE